MDLGYLRSPERTKREQVDVEHAVHHRKEDKDIKVTEEPMLRERATVRRPVLVRTVQVDLEDDGGRYDWNHSWEETSFDAENESRGV